MDVSLPIGPFVLPGSLLALAVATICTLWIAKRLGGLRGDEVQGLIWQSLFFGLCVARLAFVWQFGAAYLEAPLDVLDIRDGGWRSDVGFIAGWLYALAQMAHKPLLKRPLLWAMAAGSSLWLAGSVALAAMPGTGQSLPDIELTTAQGARVNLSSFKGAPTVVNLWATWCPPCVREMPVLAQAQIDHPSVHFVFINQREPAERVTAWLAARQLKLRHVLLDDSRKAGAAFGHSALPTTLFFDANGHLVSIRVGELSKATLAEKLRKVMPPGSAVGGQAMIWHPSTPSATTAPPP